MRPISAFTTDGEETLRFAAHLQLTVLRRSNIGLQWASLVVGTLEWDR